MLLQRVALAGCFSIVGLALWLSVFQSPSIQAAVLTSAPEPQKTPTDVVVPVTVSGITAAAYAVQDLTTGAVLVAHNETAVLPIASVTKLFTAAALLADHDLFQSVVVTAADVATEGRAGKLRDGETYTKRELLWPLMLESSNDAAAALERSTPMLLDDMHALVVALGATHTQFADASGLSAANVSSAHELAALVASLWRAEPHLFDISQLPQFITDNNGWVNNSPVLTEAAYRGGKHGFTNEAGRTGVFVFQEGDQHVVYVLLGSADVQQDVAKLRESLF